MRSGKDSPMEPNLNPPLVSLPCVCICRNRVRPRVVTCRESCYVNIVQRCNVALTYMNMKAIWLVKYKA